MARYAASPVTANAGGTLGGSGTVGGPVTIASGATLDPGGTAGAVGTLTMGALTLNAGSQLSYDLGQPNVISDPNNDLVQVNGNLALGGVVNVNAPGSSFADTLLPGSYRLINYTGTLSGSTAVGSIPSGFAASQIQTVIPSQVNLIAVQNGVPMQFWDGVDTTGNSVLNGGTGTWNNGAGNWTDTNGSINQSWIPGVQDIHGRGGRRDDSPTYQCHGAAVHERWLSSNQRGFGADDDSPAGRQHAVHRHHDPWCNGRYRR